MNAVSKTECIERYALAFKLLDAEHSKSPTQTRAAFWEIVNAMLVELRDLTASTGETLSTNCSHAAAEFLLSVARSSAGAAVRESNRLKLFQGLQALGIEDAQHSDRETLIELCLLDNSAKRLGIDIVDVFDELKHLFSPRFIEICTGYFSSEVRTIEAYGYVECTDKLGRFAYRQNRC